MSSPTADQQIVDELLKLSGESNLTNAVEKLGILKPGPKSCSVLLEKPWYRAGSETYIASFLVHSEAESKHLVLKACTPSSPAIPIEILLQTWIDRRKAISEKIGTHLVPKLYGYGGGVLLEEYIEFSMAQALEQNPAYINAVIEGCERLRSLGYNASLLFHDLRSRGSDVVLIDFGEDLGRPSPSNPPFIRELHQFALNHQFGESVLGEIEKRIHFESGKFLN
jgi:hypothetical protein